MGFTKKIYYETMLWINDDDNNTDDIATENALDFLNNTDKLCTPSFILRREIKRLVDEKAINLDIDVEKFPTETNEKLPDDIVEIFSRELASIFKDYGIHSNQWASYLKDESFCNRQTAIKIIFAFGMDEETAQKFLLVNGHNLFSVRNPFDYICIFCKKCGFNFNEAQNMLKLFEEGASIPLPYVAEKTGLAENMTIELKNETENISRDAKIKDADEKKTRLIKYMLQNQSEFVAKVERKRKGQVRRVEYPSGFSIRKIKMLKLFTKYLAILYPTFMKSSVRNGEWYLMKKSASSTYNQLKTAIHQFFGLDAIDLNFAQYKEQDINVKKVAAIAYKNSFNGSVILPLKNMPQILRAIMRSPEKPDNSHDLDRSTIILLTYFFIDGCRYAIQKQKMPSELAIENLEKTISNTTDAAEKALLIALKDIVYKINDLLAPPASTDDDAFYNPKPLDTYIDAINVMLNCFDFCPFYVPFMMDRFVLFCLLKSTVNYEDERQYLLKAVLQRAKEQTDDKIKSKIPGVHDE